MNRQPTLFDGARRTIDDSIGLTVESMRTFGPTHRHWAIAWSGGKDSTLLLVLIWWLIDSKQIEPPETLTVLYADTRMELPPLSASAHEIMGQLRSRGVEVRIVLPDMDDRFFVYLLGRGVPPPNNNTLRWCTAQIKVEPMERELARLVGHLGQKVLMLTGVRIGESASRDSRIALSCGKNGAECGQGWFQETLPESLCDTLAPILHWRVCHVWQYLRDWAPTPRHGEFNTALLAEAYGGDQAEENHARTGCLGCPLANRDTALDYVLSLPSWRHLDPLKELRPLYRELRLPKWRLRKPGGETRADGTLVANQNRMGPLTMDARRMALGKVLDIQARVNSAGLDVSAEVQAMLGPEDLAELRAKRRRPAPIDILNAEEVVRIEELITANTWPQKWTGDEPVADEPYEDHFADGTRQQLIFGE